MNQPKISVIVPIYNIEAYLRKCLDSVAAQTFQDFEVILINDGSTDGSPAIAQEFADRYTRFTLLSKPNGGLASARNIGITLARGEYLAFIDSDDFIAPDYLQKLYAAASSTGADVVCCNFKKYFLRPIHTSTYPFRKKAGVYTSKSIIKSLLHDFTIQNYTWNKLYLKKLFTDHNIEFPKIHFEDMSTTIRLFYFSQKIAVITDPLYFYTQRSDSIVYSFCAATENDFLRSFANIRVFLEEQHAYDSYRPDFTFLMWKSFTFIWSVVFILQFQKRTCAGMWGNLKRSTQFLNYYRSKKFKLDAELDHRNIIRTPCAPVRVHSGKRKIKQDET